MSRNQTLNERQREKLSTCLSSCRNIAYPSLGMPEEAAEYVQKLLYMIDWNPDLPQADRNHLEFLLKGFANIGLAIGAYAKKYRHSAMIPFSLKKESDQEFPDLFCERLEGLRKEIGDVEWMTDAIDFYIVHCDGTDPTDPNVSMTAQDMNDQNWQKLSERLCNDTIDGKGDNIRSSVS